MDKKKYVFLEYTFLFEPSTAWTSLSSFETDLADFFGAHGMDAEIIKTVDGQMGKRILLIQKAEEIKGQPPSTSIKPTPKIPVKADIDKFRNKKY